MALFVLQLGQRLGRARVTPLLVRLQLCQRLLTLAAAGPLATPRLLPLLGQAGGLLAELLALGQGRLQRGLFGPALLPGQGLGGAQRAPPYATSHKTRLDAS